MHVVHFVEQMHCTGVHTTILVYAVSTVHLMRVAGGGGGAFLFSCLSRCTRRGFRTDDCELSSWLSLAPMYSVT